MWNIPTFGCVMRNLIYLFKVLYDIACDRAMQNECASISINHSTKKKATLR